VNNVGLTLGRGVWMRIVSRPSGPTGKVLVSDPVRPEMPLNRVVYEFGLAVGRADSIRTVATPSGPAGKVLVRSPTK